MTNQVITGKGVNLVNGTVVYGEIQNVSEVMEAISKIDTSAHNNVGSVKTSRPGFSENSEMNVDLGFTGDTWQSALRTSLRAGTVSTWQVVAPCAGISMCWTFSGYISGVGTPKFDKDGNGTISFKVQPSGVVSEVSTALAVGVTGIAVIDGGSTALTLSPAFAAGTYGYQITTDLADTGVAFNISGTGTGESVYVNNALATAGTTGSAIAIPTAAGSVIMIPVVKFCNGCVPKVYWIEVTHGPV